MKNNSQASQLLLGLGGTVDYEVHWDSATIVGLINEFGLTDADLDPTLEVHSERDLVRCALGILQGGGGGERFVHAPHLIEEFSQRFAYDITLGGTGVRAGLALAQLSVPSTVHLVSIDDHVRRLLPADVHYLSSADQDTLDPHLIIQYPAGISIQLPGITITTGHPNRIIMAHDVANKMLELHPDLPQTLAQADVFLACGFNVIRDQDVLEDRLGTVARAMENMPPDSLVFFEEAEYHVAEFSAQVRAIMVRHAGIYSMNEDELQAILSIKIDLDNSQEVAQALRALQVAVPAKILLVHTKFWAVMLGLGAIEYADCLESAVAIAATRYRVGDTLDLAAVNATRKLPHSPVGTQVIADLSIEFGPDLVGTPAYVIDIDQPTTIGLGDTFGAGFIYEYHRQLHSATAQI